MGRLGTAFQAFFKSLLDGAAAERVAQALQPSAALPAPKPPPEPARPVRSEAVTLLAALQREARLVDFVMEPIDDYSDQQIGAAARDVHRGCREVIQRMFDVGPLVEEAEQAAIEVPAGYDTSKFQLIGNVGEPPLRGQLLHPGWAARNVKLPAWTGSKESAGVISPAEVEIR